MDQNTQDVMKLNDEDVEKVSGGMDDGSPDNAGKILDDYSKKDKRVKVVHLDKKDTYYSSPEILPKE